MVKDEDGYNCADSAYWIDLKYIGAELLVDHGPTTVGGGHSNIANLTLYGPLWGVRMSHPSSGLRGGSRG